MTAPVANASANVLVGKPNLPGPASAGGVAVGPLGTALPTDAVTAPAAAIKGVGYISDGGLTQTIGEDTNPIKAWGGDTVRTVSTSHDYGIKFVMIETQERSLAVYYGAAQVSGDLDAGLEVQIKAASLDHSVFVADVLDGDVHVRVCLPDGQVTERGDIVWTDGDAVAYEVTVTAYPDASGVKAYQYMIRDDGTP